MAEVRQVASFLEVTGSLAAQEESSVAPETSGQIIATPVDVGAFVSRGTVLARLDDRDARLRLQQAQAGVGQAVAGVRQAEARLGLGQNGRFDATAIPEVRAALAARESADAAARLAEVNLGRYASLVETGDVARSVYDQARTQAETARAAASSARQQYEASLNAARGGNQGIRTAEAAVESARAQVAIAQKAIDDAVVRAPFGGYVSERPVAVGEYVTPASRIATVLRTNPIQVVAASAGSRSGQHLAGAASFGARVELRGSTIFGKRRGGESGD
jgi:multidrug resistance efflux pump